jgi:hypothetical protein
MRATCGQHRCSRCRRIVTPRSGEPTHVLHLAIAAATLGLWLPVWWVLTIRGYLICPHCQDKVGRSRVSRVLLYVLGTVHVAYFLVVSAMYVMVILSMP